MKKIIKLQKRPAITAILFIILTFIGGTGCKKPSPSPTPTSSPGSLIFHFHTYVGNIEDTVAQHPLLSQDGIPTKLYFSNIFISNIRLITAAGDTIAPLKDTIVLKHWDEETYPLGPVPAGNYKTVKFDVGIPASINHTSPGQYASSEPYSDLNAFWYGNQNEMWSGSTTNGYIFANIMGYVDSSSHPSPTDSATQPFSYQIGGDQNRITILMPEQDFTVTSGIPWTVHMTIDFAYFLHGLNLKTQNTCNFVTNPALAAQMAKNITAYTVDSAYVSQKAMFKYEPN